MRFKDRRHAGELLGETVRGMEPTDPVVFGLPRGGVPVAERVADALGCPLDVLMVRKVGVPFQPELAMGAIGEGGMVVRNDEVIVQAQIDPVEFDRELAKVADLLESRMAGYRDAAPAIPAEGRTAIIVDDGLATGSTARAAIQVMRLRDPLEVWIAVPVAPAETLRGMSVIADRALAVEVPAHFGAVGFWYKDFAQTSDDEVRNLLATSRLR